MKIIALHFCVLVLLGSLPGFSQTQETTHTRIVRMTNQQMDSIYNIRERRAIQKALKKIAAYEINTRKDTLINISIAGGHLREVPEFIQYCTNLKLLRMESNNFDSFPAFMGNLHELIYLNLTDNNLTEIPGFIFQLENLETLNLSSNRITKLPRELNRMEHLKEIGLYNMHNNIRKLKIRKNNTITRMVLRGNDLKKLPRSIKKLKK